MKSLSSIWGISILLIVLVTGTSKECLGDDASYRGDGATVFPVTNCEIQLVSEEIRIAESINASEWNVDVIMNFKNFGPDTDIQLGFPFSSSHSDRATFDPRFRTFVDGKELTTIKKTGVVNPALENFHYPIVYTFNVHFKKAESKTIRHSYSVGGYINSSGDRSFSYILKTGSLWKGIIEKIDVTLTLSVKTARSVTFVSPKEHRSKRNNDKIVLYWSFSDIEPQENISLGASSSFHSHASSSLDEIIAGSKKDIATAAPPSLRYLRNRILATSGYPFKSDFVYSQFYHQGSGLSPNENFTFDLVPEKARNFLEYLSMIDTWNSKELKRIKESVPYTIKNDSHFQIHGGSTPLYIDRKRSSYIVLWRDKYLLWFDLASLRFKGVLELPGDGFTRFGYTPIHSSPDGRLLALNWSISRPRDIHSVGYRRILLIDLEKIRVDKEIMFKYDDDYSNILFSSDSKELFTNHGVYDVSSEKERNEWSYLKPMRVKNCQIGLVPGKLKNDVLIFRIHCRHHKNGYRIYYLDTKTGNDGIEYLASIFSNVENPVYDTSKFENYSHISISPNGEYLVNMVKYGINRNPYAEINIWRYDKGNFSLLYTETLTYQLAKIVGGSNQGACTFQWSKDNRYLFTLTEGGLSRYKIGSQGKVKKATIQIVDESHKYPIRYLRDSLVIINSRVYDIETGRKLWPWYEVFDSFDSTNRLPFYDENPAKTVIRNF